jgi:predicted dehydrogenase
MSGKKFTLITLDPGHFHAALVQKKMYDQIDSVVYVYAPEGQDVKDHLKRIEAFNSRPEDPTTWEEVVYTGPDFLEKMITQKPGNVVVISGNNLKKSEYITHSVEAGLHVLADKPMVILPEQFPGLVETFRLAEEKDVLLYDIMTERYEITTMLQKELVGDSGCFRDPWKKDQQKNLPSPRRVYIIFSSLYPEAPDPAGLVL